MTAPQDPGPSARTDAIAAPEPDSGTVLAGRYELRERLGSGGMSRVFLAHDRELGRTVAVKLLARDGGDLGRLRDEARAAAAVDHPGVVTVHDVGTTPTGLHVVMSYLDGESLAERLDRDGPLAPAAVVAVGRAVCDALGAAHRAGVVHRDVTPGNVMLRSDGGVTVTDFGIARSGEGAGRTATGHVIGTPAYMAPEQARADAVLDGRADLYALGCTLFAALTGRPPFTDADPVSVVLAHVRELPPRPSALVDGVPPDLERVILRALAKDPGRRHPDAAAMEADLAAAAGGPGRTQPIPGPGGGNGTLTLPPGSPGSPGGPAEPVERAVADADAAVPSDRRRNAGLVLLAVAALLLLGLLTATVLLP